MKEQPSHLSQTLLQGRAGNRGVGPETQGVPGTQQGRQEKPKDTQQACNQQPLLSSGCHHKKREL